MRTFNLSRHATVKARLNKQLIKANSDTRLLSLCKRYMTLAKALQNMNARNGLIPRKPVESWSLQEQFESIKWYKTKLNK